MLYKFPFLLLTCIQNKILAGGLVVKSQTGSLTSACETVWSNGKALGS